MKYPTTSSPAGLAAARRVSTEATARHPGIFEVICMFTSGTRRSAPKLSCIKPAKNKSRFVLELQIFTWIESPIFEIL